MTDTPEMDRKVFLTIVKEYIVPLFSAQSAVDCEDATKTGKPLRKGHEMASLGRNDQLRLYPGKNASYRAVIQRSQYFDRANDVQTARTFLSVLSEVHCRMRIVDVRDPQVQDALKAAVRRSVARHLARQSTATAEDAGRLEELLVNIIDTLSSWSEQTYEGGRIRASIGVEKSSARNAVPIMDVLKAEDLAKVMSNGFDTVLVADWEGQLVRHEELDQPTQEEMLKGKFMAPARLSSLAKWSSSGARVVVALNRNGEISLFQKGVMVFAKRLGNWHRFAHEPVLHRMQSEAKIGNEELKRAVYLTALDVSFARTGGCLAVVNRHSQTRINRDRIVSNKEKFQTEPRRQRLKAKCLKQVFSGRFQSQDRRLRQEVLAIDGATVLDNLGRPLAAGSIVKVKAGSKGGGGRSAAAVTLGKYGLAIKISADGGIIGYAPDGKGRSKEIFRVSKEADHDRT
jgi:hypothetical protein